MTRRHYKKVTENGPLLAQRFKKLDRLIREVAEAVRVTVCISTDKNEIRLERGEVKIVREAELWRMKSKVLGTWWVIQTGNSDEIFAMLVVTEIVRLRVQDHASKIIPKAKITITPEEEGG
jgi:hypothetical protein